MVFHWVSRTKSWIEIDFSFGRRKILHRTIQRKTIEHDTNNVWGNIMLAWHKTPIICWSCFRKIMIVIISIGWMSQTIIHWLNFIKGRIATTRVVRTEYRYTVGCISHSALVSIGCLLYPWIFNLNLSKKKQTKRIPASIGNKTGTVGTRNEFDCSVMVDVDPVSAQAEWSGIPFESIWILWPFTRYFSFAMKKFWPIKSDYFIKNVIEHPDLIMSWTFHIFAHFCSKAIDDCNDIHPNCFRLK